MSADLSEYKQTIFTFEKFNLLYSPMVYIWRRDDEVLFVGGSKSGLGRFGKSAFTINGQKPLITDTITIIWCKLDEVNSLSLELERFLNPTIKGKTKFVGTTWETKDELMERRQEEIREKESRKSFVDKLVDEELPLARWTNPRKTSD